MLSRRKMLGTLSALPLFGFLAPAAKAVNPPAEPAKAIGGEFFPHVRSSVIPGVGFCYAYCVTQGESIPDGWAECNGQILDDERSVYHGTKIPDMNGEYRGFGRVEEEWYPQNINVKSTSPTHATNFVAPVFPVYYRVTYIMRVR